MLLHEANDCQFDTHWKSCAGNAMMLEQLTYLKLIG